MKTNTLMYIHLCLEFYKYTNIKNCFIHERNFMLLPTQPWLQRKRKILTNNILVCMVHFSRFRQTPYCIIFSSIFFYTLKTVTLWKMNALRMPFHAVFISTCGGSTQNVSDSTRHAKGKNKNDPFQELIHSTQSLLFPKPQTPNKYSP